MSAILCRKHAATRCTLASGGAWERIWLRASGAPASAARGRHGPVVSRQAATWGPTDTVEGARKRKIALVLAYDGANYQGIQINGMAPSA